jgi:DNA-binding beta-propeller fold protein YncE
MKSACLLGFGLIAGCTASAADVAPPKDQLFFPTGMAVAPDDSVLFVANADSELRYDSGSVNVFDLALVDSTAAAWVASKTIPDGCNQDPDHTETLACDEAQFMKVPAGVRIGNFATDMAVQDRGGGQLRLIVPTRGDPSITWIDYDGNALDCGSGEGFGLCDDDHRLTTIHNDPDVGTLPPEPFGAFADSAGDFAVVTHLTSGAVTLIDSPKSGKATIADVSVSLFEPDPLTGLRGSSGVAGRTPHALGDIVYVGSRAENRIQQITVGRPVNDAPPYILPGNFFFIDSVGLTAGQSANTRGMGFSDDGNRLYLVNRLPPTIQIYDTSFGTEGFPNDTLLAATDICRDASTLTVLPTADGDRIYTTCFDDGEVYIVDPRGAANVDNIILSGRGPYSIVTAPTRNKVYVSNFLEDSISVIDAANGPTHDRIVLRIGQSRAPGGS